MRANALASVVSTSENMLQQAKAGHWDNVALAEEKRRRLIDHLFADPVDSGDVIEINHTLREIIRINRLLEQLAIAARDQTRQELEKIRDGRSAVHSYVENT